MRVRSLVLGSLVLLGSACAESPTTLSPAERKNDPLDVTCHNPDGYEGLYNPQTGLTCRGGQWGSGH